MRVKLLGQMMQSMPAVDLAVQAATVMATDRTVMATDLMIRPNTMPVRRCALATAKTPRYLTT